MQSKTDKFKECTWIVISPMGITVCPKTHLLVYMKLTNINDNLSNYIFQASVKLSLVVSSVKVGSCHTLEQERFCWEIWKKLKAVSAYTAPDQAELQQQGTKFLRD